MWLLEKVFRWLKCSRNCLKTSRKEVICMYTYIYVLSSFEIIIESMKTCFPPISYFICLHVIKIQHYAFQCSSVYVLLVESHPFCCSVEPPIFCTLQQSITKHVVVVCFFLQSILKWDKILSANQKFRIGTNPYVGETQLLWNSRLVD